MSEYAPSTSDELTAILLDLGARGNRCTLRGGGSKAAIGAPVNADIVDMSGFHGIVAYDPPELVLTVRAGTPLAEVEALVAAEGQMLGFEPFDHGSLLGVDPGGATIGGVVAAGVSGPRRPVAGGARDHLLGFSAVSGRGERFVAGGKVVKNVTGYDLPKLIAGSWGRLAAITEVTLKVVPRPRVARTLAISGLDASRAVGAMAQAMGSHADVGAAAHFPRGKGLPSTTLFRIEGFAPSVEARSQMLPKLLWRHGPCEPVPDDEAAAMWNAVRHVEPLRDERVLWRVSIPPSAAPALIARHAPADARWLLDWAGGLLWLAGDGDAAAIRSDVAAAGGHAALIRAPEQMRARIPFQHPRSNAVAALEARVRRAFDPKGVFETGRFLDASDAH